MALVRIDRFGRLVHTQKEQEITLDTPLIGGKRRLPEKEPESTESKQNRSARSIARKALPALEKSEVLSSLSDLQLASVKPGTVKLYVGLWTEMIAFAKKRRAAINENTVDQLLKTWMSDSYMEGFQSGRGSQMIAAVKFFFPVFARGGQRKLTQAAQALRGWRAKAPGLTRLPLPWEVVALIAHSMIKQGHTWMGFLVILQHHCYLRPAEIFRVKGGMLIRPVPGTSHANWNLVLHPHEAGQPSKTKEFDEVVVADLPEFKQLLDHSLCVLKATTANQQMLFRFSQQEFTKQFKLALEA